MKEMKMRNWDEGDLMKMIELEQNKTFFVQVCKEKKKKKWFIIKVVL